MIIMNSLLKYRRKKIYFQHSSYKFEFLLRGKQFYKKAYEIAKLPKGVWDSKDSIQIPKS